MKEFVFHLTYLIFRKEIVKVVATDSNLLHCSGSISVPTDPKNTKPCSQRHVFTHFSKCSHCPSGIEMYKSKLSYQNLEEDWAIRLFSSII